jgi:adenylate cyclase class 2
MNQNPDHLEVEVKFHLNHPEETLQQLVDLGAVAHSRVFETNVRFEDAEHNLKANHQLLRLRQDDKCRLTYKCRPRRTQSQCKVFREVEVEVGDFMAMRDILVEIGYHPVQTYEKWRQTFHWNEVELCLDTMPYGDFLEIEGPEKNIKKAARRLGLPWEKRILSNYLAMFEAMRAHYKLPFHDVTFANFELHPVDIVPLLENFETQAKAVEG